MSLIKNRWMWDHLEDMQRKAEHYKRKYVKGHQVSHILYPLNSSLTRNKMDLET